MRSVLFLAPFLAMACASTSAASIEGDIVQFTYWYPDEGTLWYDDGYQAVGGAGAIFRDTDLSWLHGVESRVLPSSIVMTMDDGSINDPEEYFGYVFTDLTEAFPGSYVLTASTVDLLPSSNFYSTVGNTFVVNLAGLSAIDGQTITFSLVSAVPEPETYAMLLAGLGLTGVISRRRRKKQTGA